MGTPSPSTQAVLNTPLPFQWHPSDETFHLAPFLTLDQHMISPVYYSLADIHAPDVDQHHQIPHDHGARPLSSPNPTHPQIRDDLSQPLDGSDLGDDDPPRNEFNGVDHKIPKPRNSREAYLLLEVARVDCSIILTRESLVHKIIHRNTLVLQYNKEVLERTQDNRRAAERFVGQVRFSIRKSGQSAVFEYAMQEDHLPLNTSEQPYSSFDVDLT